MADDPDRILAEWERKPGELPDVFAALAGSERRAIIRRLREIGGPVAMADLARDLAEQSHGSQVDERRKRTPRQLLSSLHNVPKLVEVAAVDFDESRRTITRGANFSEITRLLDTIEGGRDC